MHSGTPYALIDEMLETPDILRRFDPACVQDWAAATRGKKRLLLSGEGSSRIFPAKNTIDLARRSGCGWHIFTEGARQSVEYDLRDSIIVGTSNSGRTRELLALFETAKAAGIPCYGVTAAAGSPLAALADDCRVLSCGAEKAIAASKSVIEQALILQSLLGGDEWAQQDRAADDCAEILQSDIAPEIAEAAAGASVLYFAGRNNGTAEELTLKTNEIVRKKSGYLEGTYALHGIEEVMQTDETVVLIEPFHAEIEKYREVLSLKAGLKVIAIASFDTPFPTLKIPALAGFDGYFQLMAGWNILVAAGLANGINLDKPLRARKVGNAD
ncbi:MAG: SIS domain-containing protein [Alphaproteobacteria bacterium]|nr:SIS domain-containing protein [Alphaproteobacteria bacterium]